MGVQAGAHGGAPQGQLFQVGVRVLQAADRLVDLGRIAREFLAQGHRDRVLKVGAPDLDRVRERPCLTLQALCQAR